jgi:prepilin peptidase CpaA
MWTNVLLIILLFICVITDLRERKIYNKVLLPFLIISISFHLILDGLSGLTTSLVGTMVGFLILIIPYFMGGMGAGDVKLLAVVGTIKGMNFVLVTALYMGIIGGIIGLLILFFRRGSINRLKQIFYFFVLITRGIRIPIITDKEGLQTTYPYGVAIALGAVGAIYEATGGLF